MSDYPIEIERLNINWNDRFTGHWKIIALHRAITDGENLFRVPLEWRMSKPLPELLFVYYDQARDTFIITDQSDPSRMSRLPTLVECQLQLQSGHAGGGVAFRSRSTQKVYNSRGYSPPPPPSQPATPSYQQALNRNQVPHQFEVDRESVVGQERQQSAQRQSSAARLVGRGVATPPQYPSVQSRPPRASGHPANRHQGTYTAPPIKTGKVGRPTQATEGLDPERGEAGVREEQTSQELDARAHIASHPVTPSDFETRGRQAFTPYVAEVPERAERAAAAWEDKEPNTAWDPSGLLDIETPEHDLHDEQELGEGWMIRATSVRGKSHRHQGEWRDDCIAAGRAGKWRYLIACDGAGSASHSRLGSYLASQAAEEAIQAALKTEEPGPVDPKTPATLKLVKRTLKTAGIDALDAIKAHAQQMRAPLRSFHTTLLMLITWQHEGIDCFGILQVGDGAIALLDERGECKVFEGADRGAHGGETFFLTSLDSSPDVGRELGSRVKFTTLSDHLNEGVSIPLVAAAVMTDGVSDDFFPEQTKLVELFTATQLAQFQDGEGQSQAGLIAPSSINHLLAPKGGEWLSRWLRYEKRQSFDDRSLVLLVHAERATQLSDRLLVSHPNT